MFILLGNLLGMVPYSYTFTSQIIVTFAMAMVVFLGVTIIAIVKHGVHFLGFFFPSGAPIYMAPLLIPIEILSYLSRPISLRSEEHTSELQSLMRISYAVFCLKKKTT